MTLSAHIFLTKASMDGKHLLRFIKCKRRRQILPHSHSPQTYVAPTKYCTTDTCKSKKKKTWLRVLAHEHRNKSKLIDWLIFTSCNQSQPAWLLFVNSSKMPLVEFTFLPCKYHTWLETYFVFYIVCKSLDLQKPSSQLFTICSLLLDPAGTIAGWWLLALTHSHSCSNRDSTRAWLACLQHAHEDVDNGDDDDDENKDDYDHDYDENCFRPQLFKYRFNSQPDWDVYKKKHTYQRNMVNS